MLLTKANRPNFVLGREYGVFFVKKSAKERGPSYVRTEKQRNVFNFIIESSMTESERVCFSHTQTPNKIVY